MQLVSYGAAARPAYLARLVLDDDFTGRLAGAAVRGALGTTGTAVTAIVMANDPSRQLTGDDPTRNAPGQVPYTLTVNGVVQPGGGTP